MIETTTRASTTCLGVALLFACSIVTPFTAAIAGELDDFEEEATEKKTEETEENNADGDQDAGTSKGNDSWLGLVGGIAYGFGAGGRASWMRVHDDMGGQSMPATANSDDIRVSSREYGTVNIPFVCTELAYMNAKSDIHVVEAGVELGYGPVALRYRHSYMRESDTRDDLQYVLVHGLYRMSMSDWLEIDLGFGSGFLGGEDWNSGFSFTMPWRVAPQEWWSVHWAPTWSYINDATVVDTPLGLALGRRFVSVRAGYRWLRSGRARLDGPFVLGAFHY